MKLLLVRRCAELLRADRQRDRRYWQRGRPLLYHQESGKLQGKQPVKFSQETRLDSARRGASTLAAEQAPSAN